MLVLVNWNLENQHLHDFNQIDSDQNLRAALGRFTPKQGCSTKIAPWKRLERLGLTVGTHQRTKMLPNDYFFCQKAR